MRPVTLSLTLGAADQDAIAQSQSLSAAGTLTLNGSFVSGGVATFDGGSTARQVKFTFGANHVGKSFNVYGKILQFGATVIEPVAGTSVSATTTNYFFEVSRITAGEASTVGGVEVGTSDIGATPWVPFDHYQVPTNVGFAVSVPSTSPPTWTLQYTFDNLWDQSLRPSDVTVFSDSAFTAKTTSLNGNFVAPCTGVRLQISSGTTTGELTVIQSGPQV